MPELIQCRRIQKIVWPDESLVEAGKYGCVEMQISMESGQMAGVPWVRVLMEDGTVHLHNCAELASISLTDPQFTQD